MLFVLTGLALVELVRADTLVILHDFWIVRLFRNITGYALVILPIALVVLSIKYEVLPKSCTRHSLFRFIFVGNNPEDHDREFKLPLVQSDLVDDGNNKKTSQNTKRPATLVYCFFGLQFSYLIWGLLQEKIMTQSYEVPSLFFNANQHLSHNLIKIDSSNHTASTVITHRIRFQNSQFLVFINRILSFFLATCILLYQKRANLREYLFHSPQPPFYQFLYSSLSNTLSTWCQYEALKFVSFPLQVLSKSCKMIPTLVMSQLLRKVKHKRSEWLLAFGISLGMFIFLLNEHQEVSSHRAPSSSLSWTTLGSGVLILGLYLFFDSFTSNWQNVLLDRYNMSHIHMMSASNFFGILLTSISLMQQSDFFPAFQVLWASSELLRDALFLSICSAIGQLFIFYTIKQFGAVTFTMIMTLRQAFAILLSCFFFAHSITIFGALGILIVMLSVFTQNILKFYGKKRNRDTQRV